MLGMTPGLLACLSPHLSLYRDSDPDPNAADPLVLHAMAEALGAPPPLTAAPVDETVVQVGVVASGPNGARAVRRTILRMEPPQQSGGPAPAGAAVQPFRVMDQGT